MAIKSLSGNVPPSRAVRALIFPSKTSGLATRDYEDDDSEEVSKGHFLVGTEDVLVGTGSAAFVVSCRSLTTRYSTLSSLLIYH